MRRGVGVRFVGWRDGRGRPSSLDPQLLVRAGDLGFHVGAFEGLIFQRHRHRTIEKEENLNTKFAPEAGRKPDSIVLSPVVNCEAKTGKIDPHKFSHAKWQGLREPGKNV